MKMLFIFSIAVLLISCKKSDKQKKRNMTEDLKHYTLGGLKVIDVTGNCPGNFVRLVKVRSDRMGFTTDTVSCATLDDSLKKVGRTFDCVYEEVLGDKLRSCDVKAPSNTIFVTWLFTVYN